MNRKAYIPHRNYREGLYEGPLKEIDKLNTNSSQFTLNRSGDIFRGDKFLRSFLWLLILTFSFITLYSNAEKLNQIVFWFLPFGGLLLLFNLFFWFKFFWEFLKNLSRWYKNERNSIKNLVLITLLLISFLGYYYGEELSVGVVELYNGIEFSTLFPIGISEEISENGLLSSEGMKQFAGIFSEDFKDGLSLNFEPHNSHVDLEEKNKEE